MRLSLKAKATIMGSACAVLVAFFTVVAWPLLYETLKANGSTAGPAPDIKTATPTRLTVAERATAGSRWEGTFARIPKGKRNEENPEIQSDLVILVREREGDWVKFEFWLAKMSNGILGEATINNDGRVVGKFLRVLHGTFPPTIVGPIRQLGSIDGRKWSMVKHSDDDQGGPHTTSFELTLVD